MCHPRIFELKLCSLLRLPLTYYQVQVVLCTAPSSAVEAVEGRGARCKAYAAAVGDPCLLDLSRQHHNALAEWGAARIVVAVTRDWLRRALVQWRRGGEAQGF